MKKILITGASGFVGSFLVEEALRRDLEVWAGVRKTSSHVWLTDPRIQFFNLDFEDEKGLTNLLAHHRFDYVIHSAGVVAAPRKLDYFRVNAEYTQNLVRALQRSHLPKKFTFISSLAACGPARSDDLTDFLKDTDPPKPLTTYGQSKLVAETTLRNEPDFPWLIFRPTAVYGPRERELFTFIKMVNAHIEAKMGFQKQHLTFIYVKDLARVLLDGTLSSQVQNTYFVADGDYYTPREFGALVRQALDTWAIRLTVPAFLAKMAAVGVELVAKMGGRYPVFNREKVAELTAQNWKCDIDPLVEDFNFHPEYDLEEGLKETIAWYRENKWL
ncbi:MAG: NAD(P)-dependent oxidoreductase [Bacteroidetes bacterium]|nr:MAG: NAD(P)-dependent oxidoreductase [Bacteroidota bacterium]